MRRIYIYVCTRSTVSARALFLRPGSYVRAVPISTTSFIVQCQREREEASSGSKQARTNPFHLRRASFAVGYRGRYVPSIKDVVYVFIKLDVFVDVFVLPYWV